MYNYLDSFNGIGWINKDWAGGHSQGRSTQSSIYLAGSHGSDHTIMFELFDSLPTASNDILKPGSSGSGKFSGNAPSACRNALINCQLIQVDGRTSASRGTDDFGNGDFASADAGTGDTAAD